MRISDDYEINYINKEINITTDKKAIKVTEVYTYLHDTWVDIDTQLKINKRDNIIDDILNEE